MKKRGRGEWEEVLEEMKRSHQLVQLKNVFLGMAQENVNTAFQS